MTNPFNIEKAIKRFKQLAKDAQSSGDLVSVVKIIFSMLTIIQENYQR